MDLTSWIITAIGWLISILGCGTVFSKLINGKIEGFAQKQRHQSERQDAVEKGVQALLRSQIISIYNKYTDKGSIPIYERENIDHLYTEYKALGGNGVIECLMEKLTDLPTPRHDECNGNNNNKG